MFLSACAISKTEHEPLLKRRCGGSNKRSLLLGAALVLAISTAQRIFAIKIKQTKNHAAVSQDYLLGGACFALNRKI